MTYAVQLRLQQHGLDADNLRLHQEFGNCGEISQLNAEVDEKIALMKMPQKSRAEEINDPRLEIIHYGIDNHGPVSTNFCDFPQAVFVPETFAYIA